MPNYYDLLEITRSAEEKEVRQAYRKMARKYHPDVNPGDKLAEDKFKQINEAHSVLSDAEKRRRYDKYGDRWEQADQIEQAESQARARSGVRTNFHSHHGGLNTAIDLQHAQFFRRNYEPHGVDPYQCRRSAERTSVRHRTRSAAFIHRSNRRNNVRRGSVVDRYFPLLIKPYRC